MSDYKQDAARRRDERSAKPDDGPCAGPARHKDKKRWCKGKVGREHKAVCHVYSEVKRWLTADYQLRVKNWRVLVCSTCGRELDIWYGGKKSERPEWVTK